MPMSISAAQGSNRIFERFQDTSTMMDAEYELLKQGEKCLPVLVSLFDGSAKNSFGVSYREIGLPLRCGLEVARRLGPIAKPLESYLRGELSARNSLSFVAAMALGSLGNLEEASIIALATSLDTVEMTAAGGVSGQLDLNAESAVALIKCGKDNHPAVLEVLDRSSAAAKSFASVQSFLRNRR